MATRDDDDSNRQPTAMPPLRPPGPQLGQRSAAPGRSRGGRPPVPPAPSVAARETREVPVPVIKGRLLERLRGSAVPRTAIEDPLVFEAPTDHEVAFDQREQHAALAMACIVLENLRRVGGSRVSPNALEGVLEALLPLLSAKELMEIEVEAYEMLAWIGHSIDPTLDEDPAEAPERPERNGERPVQYDPEQARIHLIRRAVREGFDLKILYYTGGRGELMNRRVTPQRIEAEKYLHGYCHTREDERVFRISRMAGVEPVGGRPVRPESHDEDGGGSPSGGEPAPRQSSLFTPQAPRRGQASLFEGDDE